MNNYQENIKYLIQRPKIPVIKPPMHRSMFNSSIRREFKLNKGCHQPMGYAEVKVNEPSEFLKKKSRKVIRPFVSKISKLWYLLLYLSKLWRMILSKSITSIVFVFFSLYLAQIFILQILLKHLSYLLNLDHSLIFGPVIYRKY